MINEVVLTALFKVLNRIFPFLAKKIYSESDFIKHIDVDVRSSNPVEICLNGKIPEVTIYLKITNRSPYLDVEFDRAVFSLWVQNGGRHSLIKDFWILSPVSIKKGEGKEIFCQKELNKFQVDFVKRIKDSKGVTASLSSFKLWFNSSVYPSAVIETDLENKPCRIS